MNEQVQQIRDFAQRLLDATRNKDEDFFVGQHIGLYAVLSFIDSLKKTDPLKELRDDLRHTLG